MTDRPILKLANVRLSQLTREAMANEAATERAFVNAIDAHTARRHAAEAAGRAAFLAGIPVEKAPNQDYEHWRVGWFTARNERSQAFESYIKHQTLFDQQYCPPAYRGDPKALAQLQEKRQQWIARIAVEFPEIPAAYAKWKKHKEGK